MLLEIILFLILGIFFGTICGLIPGIHINLVGASLVFLSVSLLSDLNPIYLVVFIVSMSISQTFIDFIPGIFLGCPDTDTALSTLPGHQMLKKGEGYEAVMLTSFGCLMGVFILILVSIPSIFVIPKVYDKIEPFVPYLLIAVSLSLVLSEKKKFNALFAFLICGILGFLVLNMTINSEMFLLPLLTGLFGSSMLLISIKNKTKVPRQKITEPRIKTFKPIAGAIMSSPISIFLPAIGSGQVAIIGTSLVNLNNKGFLFLLGATNVLIMGFSFFALYTIDKTRTGSAVAIQQILGNISANIFILILITILITGIISFFITKFLVKYASQIIERINYTKLSIYILIFVTIIITIFSGFLGLIVFVASTLTGIYVISMDVKKTNMMGCLIVPTIILYLF
ncbi:tripartite tricarboxylate transporter permease [Candidatus Pacearchaeota archaeon]|nr:tripartite tricarboxylate transporter permease [Candidatus Pacearchaeota archaeon]